MKKILSLIILILSFQAFCMDHEDLNKSRWSIFIDENQRAYDKQEQLWGMISKTPYKTNLPEIIGPDFEGAMELMDPEFDAKAFSNNTDILEQGRKKHIHTFGTCTKITFIPSENSPFTGIFASKALGILRLSLAVPASEEGFIFSANAKPGIAVKFFVDNKPSLNTFAMPSLGGQESANLFEYNYTNDLPKPSWSPKTAILECRFAKALEHLGQANGNARSLSSEHLASITSDGKEVSMPLAPYELIFMPTKEAKLLFKNAKMKHDFRKILENKGESITLFEVRARLAKTDTQSILIGSIVTTENFIASEFGDNLFFKHPRVHDNH